MSDETATKRPPANVEIAFEVMVWARITAGSGRGPYAFTQVIPEAGGGWTDGPITDDDGKDPAWCMNPDDFQPPRIVRLWRTESKTWAFE